MKNRKIIYSIIDAFMHHGNPSEFVTRSFGKWLVDDDFRIQKDEALESQWNRMSAVADGLESSDSLKEQYELLEYSSKSKGRSGRILPWCVAAAAACLFVVSVCWNVFSPGTSGTGTVCYVSGKDSKGEFDLPDGSRVWLNAGSSLSFSDDFGSSGERLVSVAGEAFFDVVKDRKPFVVALDDDIRVKVHGTRFNVRNSVIFESVQVALQSGSVEVINRDNRKMLVPGTCYTYNPAVGTYTIEHVNTANFSNWTKPYVVFKDEAFGDILTTLEHWHNVKITAEKVVDKTLSLSFTLKNEPIEDTFALLQTLTGYRCSVIDANHVVISK